jgi:hypothetical protein
MQVFCRGYRDRRASTAEAIRRGRNGQEEDSRQDKIDREQRIRAGRFRRRISARE